MDRFTMEEVDSEIFMMIFNQSNNLFPTLTKVAAIPFSTTWFSSLET